MIGEMKLRTLCIIESMVPTPYENTAGVRYIPIYPSRTLYDGQNLGKSLTGLGDLVLVLGTA